jgi:hypothetical protein
LPGSAQEVSYPGDYYTIDLMGDGPDSLWRNVRVFYGSCINSKPSIVVYKKYAQDKLSDEISQITIDSKQWIKKALSSQEFQTLTHSTPDGCREMPGIKLRGT